MEENKKIRRLEPAVKAPASIGKKVQATLSTYRTIGDVAGLYLDSFSQTLIGFTTLISPINKKKNTPKT